MNAAASAIAADARPRLPRGVRLAHSEAQGGWVLLAPERVFKADQLSVEDRQSCTGEATFGAIIDDLAKAFTRRGNASWPMSRPCCADWPTNGCWNFSCTGLVPAVPH